MKELYLVMRLNRKVEMVNQINGAIEDVELGDCAGYMPVFDNIKDAEDNACNGKYQIVQISEVVK